jgi:predicted Rossmann fold flavoprotein
MTPTVTILGAGPAGMTAALFAARAGCKVQLIDRNEKVGRKLLVTGAGRANLTNQQMDAGRYTCGDPSWMQTVLSRFGHNQLIQFFKEIGVLTYSTPDGWCYPLSESAHSVVACFENALHLAGVKLLLDQHITAMRKTESGFTLTTKDGIELKADHLIVAAGGKASPALGSTGDLFPALRVMGHTVLPLTPALAPVTAEMKPWQRLQGVRLDVRASLFENETLLAETTGNLIFTQWGLNGPAVMDLSHHISARPNAHLDLYLNLLFSSEAALRELVSNFRQTPTPLVVLLGAVLQPKIAPVILPMVKLAQGARLDQITDGQIEKVINLLKHMHFQVTGVRGFEYCQISAGGVPVSEVEPETMRSRIIPNLSLVGETLDVVGPCGGYNLQFAFSSGALARMGIANL